MAKKTLVRPRKRQSATVLRETIEKCRPDCEVKYSGQIVNNGMEMSIKPGAGSAFEADVLINAARNAGFECTWFNMPDGTTILHAWKRKKNPWVFLFIILCFFFIFYPDVHKIYASRFSFAWYRQIWRHFGFYV